MDERAESDIYERPGHKNRRRVAERPRRVALIHLVDAWRGFAAMIRFLKSTAEDSAGSESGYSWRRATRGSMRVARRAGTQQAKRAIAVSSRTTTANVSGSLGLMPTMRPLIKRVPASAITKPRARPMPTTP